MKKIFLLSIFSGVLTLVLPFFITNVSWAATCEPPTGTISVDKNEVEAGAPFKITITGSDDNDVLYLGVSYYDAGANWISDDQKCSWQQNTCTRDWTLAFATPGTYTFYGRVIDSDSADNHGCTQSNEAKTTPESVQVKVGALQPCELSKCNGGNQQPCICGQTPIIEGQCCATWNNGVGVGGWDAQDVCGVVNKCPGAIVNKCEQTKECEKKFTGNCMCGDNMINNQFCCTKVEGGTGYYYQEICSLECSATLPICPNPVCQESVKEKCFCGDKEANMGDFCCAPSGSSGGAYSSKELCEHDLKCFPTLKSCSNLLGKWCSADYSCDGTDLTSQASDKNDNPNKICCFGTCQSCELNCDQKCPVGCNVGNDPDCQPCQGGNGCCGQGCTWQNDVDCPKCDTTKVKKCDGVCTPGCSVAEDNDCGCRNDDACCGSPGGTKCTKAQDNDCSLASAPPSVPKPGLGLSPTPSVPRTNCPKEGEGLVPCGTTGCPCQFCDFFVMISGIVQFFMTKIVPVVAVLMLTIGGGMFFFAGANPNILQTAKGIFTSVAIGLVIIFTAWVVVNTILTHIGIVEGSSLLRWYDVGCK